MPTPPEKLEQFIKDQTWTFAKTYAKTWPHEYIVQEKVDPALFADFTLYFINSLDVFKVD